MVMDQNDNLPNLPRPRPKRRGNNPSNHKKTKTKIAKVHGDLHIGHKNELVAARQMNDVQCRCHPPCTTKFSLAEKEDLFRTYYELKSHSEQTLYLRTCVTMDRDYHLFAGGISHVVCQKYFLALHDIKISRLRGKVFNRVASVQDNRGKHENRKRLNTSALNKVRVFLNSLDSRESHYSRASNPNKTYLESNMTITSLYNDFIRNCPELSPFAVPTAAQITNPLDIWRISFRVFSNIFNYEFNLSFGYPRSDLCETCEKMHTNKQYAKDDQVTLQELTQQHEAHLKEAEFFYSAMKKEITEILPPDTACLCFDFEKNLPLPVTNVTSEFFCRQLWVYNLGIHDIRTGQATMFVYSETFAKKGANEVLSCLKYYIENILPQDTKKLHFFSDNSVGQNKNKYLVAYLLSLTDKFEEIKMSFPVVGHSRMPIDRDFAKIEKKKKKTDRCHFPSTWTKLIKEAQPSLPFRLIYLEHPLTDDLCGDGNPIAPVFDFRAALDPILKSTSRIRPIKVFTFSADGKINCSVNTNGSNGQDFCIGRGISVQNLRVRLSKLTRAYHGFVPLKKAKYENVQGLLKMVHVPVNLIFYESCTLEGDQEHADLDLENLCEEWDEDEIGNEVITPLVNITNQPSSSRGTRLGFVPPPTPDSDSD